MAGIIELINANMPTVQKTVDLTLSQVSATGEVYLDGMPDPALNIFFPIVNYPDESLALMRLRRFAPSIGYIVATDGEIPVDRDRVTITQELLGNLKLAKGRLFTEEDFNQMHRASMLTAIGSPAAQAILDTFLGTPAQLTQALICLHTVLVILTACTGRCVYEDPTTGLNPELSYLSHIPSGNLPAARTGNARWSQWATANGIADITNHINAYYGALRRFPSYIVMGRTEANNLRMQNSTQLTVARMKGIITDSGAPDAAAIASLEPPSMEDVSNAISRRLLAGGGQAGTTQILVSDAIYYQRGSNGVTQEKPYIPAGYYFFANPGYIERAIVPTASNNFAGGLVTTTEIISKEPPKEKVVVAGRGLPLVLDPRLIGAANVENTAIA